MHYRLSASKPLRETVPAIAARQLEAAMALLDSPGDGETAIHSARKHFKRTRALLGLVEPVARGNRAKKSRKLVASAARMLASSRDAQVAIAAAGDLEKEFGAGSNARAFSDLTSFLKARRDRAGEKLDLAGFGGVVKELEKAKASIAKLILRGATMSDLLDSACATYREGRRAMKDAIETGGDEAVHTWRKLLQRHWRHMLLLKEAWPKDSKQRIAQARHLSDLLGQHNDLAVLRQTILANRVVFRSPSDVAMLCRCIETKQSKLLKKAAARGEHLYSGKPKAISEQLRVYWHSAKQERASNGIRAAV